MNHLFDEILEFQFKIPFIFRLKKSTISYYVLLYPPCYILTLSSISTNFTRETFAHRRNILNDLQSILPNIEPFPLVYVTSSDSRKE